MPDSRLIRNTTQSMKQEKSLSRTGTVSLAASSLPAGTENVHVLPRKPGIGREACVDEARTHQPTRQFRRRPEQRKP